jgi:hypothetical protein
MIDDIFQYWCNNVSQTRRHIKSLSLKSEGVIFHSYNLSPILSTDRYVKNRYDIHLINS